MILGNALAVMPQRIESARRNDAGLPHSPAPDLAHLMCFWEQCLCRTDRASHRSAQSLTEADRDRIEIFGVRFLGDPGRCTGIPDTSAIEMSGKPLGLCKARQFFHSL